MSNLLRTALPCTPPPCSHHVLQTGFVYDAAYQSAIFGIACATNQSAIFGKSCAIDQITTLTVNAVNILDWMMTHALPDRALWHAAAAAV